MIDTYFRDQIINALDNAINEVNRDSFNLSITDQNNLNTRIENLKKCVFDLYAIKIASLEK